MSNAKIDNNRTKTAIIVDTNGNIADLVVDPVTGRLLIEITVVATSTPALLKNAKIDENREKTVLGYDGTNPQSLIIDNRNGLLYCDVLVE